MPIAVTIIEDDPQIRAHLVDLINSSNHCKLIGSARNGAEAMQLINKDEADIYLVDLGLPDADGVELIALIKNSCPNARSMVLTSFGDRKHITRSILAGASGYILKDESDLKLLEKIVALHNGESPFSPSLIKLLFQHISGQGRKKENSSKTFAQFTLTSRELEVMHFLILGLTISNIGEQISTSPHTVNQHLRSIYRKLDVRSRAMAVSKAIQNGFLEI